MICEKCNKEYDGTYGSGRFCSKQCASSFSTMNKRTEINDKVKQTWHNKSETIKIYRYVCEKCKCEFESQIRKRKGNGRHLHCDECRRKVPHVLSNPTSLSNLSFRTIAKILKRANIKCGMCGWDKTTLDIHHIISIKNGGPNTDDNLIALCPNCHRMAHEKKYTIQELLMKNVKTIFSNWQKYYHPSN